MPTESHIDHYISGGSCLLPFHHRIRDLIIHIEAILDNSIGHSRYLLLLFKIYSVFPFTFYIIFVVRINKLLLEFWARLDVQCIMIRIL